MAPRFDVGPPAEPDVREDGVFVVHRIGPEAYSIVLEVGGETLMLSVDYFNGPQEVEEAIHWLKRHAAEAKVIWRD